MVRSGEQLNVCVLHNVANLLNSRRIFKPNVTCDKKVLCNESQVFVYVQIRQICNAIYKGHIFFPTFVFVLALNTWKLKNPHLAWYSTWMMFSPLTLTISVESRQSVFPYKVISRQQCTAAAAPPLTPHVVN